MQQDLEGLSGDSAAGMDLPADVGGQAPLTQDAIPPEGGQVEAIQLSREQFDELMGSIRMAQGQGSRGERVAQQALESVQAIRPAIDQLLLNQQRPEPTIPLEEVDDPVLRSILAQLRQTSQVVEGMQQEKVMDQRLQQTRAYEIGELKRIAGLAGVEFGAIEAQLGNVDLRQSVYQHGMELITQAKDQAEPRTPAGNSQQRTTAPTRQTSGQYQETRGGTPQRSPTSKARIQDAFNSGQITSKQYEDQMRAIGEEP